MRSFSQSLQILLLIGASGCGFSHNPSYFPYLAPPGDIIRTHAKPPGAGYFADFDPHAQSLVVRPEEGTSPVRSSVVAIATIYDEKGQPRRTISTVRWTVRGRLVPGRWRIGEHVTRARLQPAGERGRAGGAGAGWSAGADRRPRSRYGGR